MNLSFDIWDEASSNILTLSLNVASQKDFPQSWLSFLFCFIFLFEYAQIQLLGNPSPLFSPLHFFPFSLSFSQLLLLFGGGLILQSRDLCPWDFPIKYTGVGCHVLLQGIFPYFFLLTLFSIRQAPMRGKSSLRNFLPTDPERWEVSK